MKNKTKIFICVVLAVMLVMTNVLLVACVDNKTYYDNETDKLVFASQDVDGVFNPFFSTSGTDSSVVGLTQIGMIGNNKDGKPVWGDDEAVVVKDLEIATTGTGKNEITTYKFVLKNNVRFSNGTYLTIKDVLFNLYVYLDPAYTGSSTIYSTDIVGLSQYRTQEDVETEQDSFKAQFEVKAKGRLEALDTAWNDIRDTMDAGVLAGLTAEGLKTKLQEYQASVSITGYENIVNDYDKILELFREELKSDYSNSKDSYEDIVFTDSNNKIYKNLFTTDVEVFLYNEGKISWNRKDGVLESPIDDVSKLKNLTEEQAIQLIFDDNIPSKIDEVYNYWATATNIFEYIVNDEMEAFFKQSSNVKYPNISGIKFANGGAQRGGEDSVKVNGVDYAKPTYNDDGSVATGNEVLSIQIHNIDPKAIWNFSFAVAPMYYYSDEAHIKAFNYTSNFGVERGSQTWLNDVVRVPHVGVPAGAGPYAASKSSGGITDIQAGDFWSNNVIYFERNPYYVMGPAKIKNIRYQVVAAAQQLNSLYNGEIHFAEPNAKPETISELNSKESEGYGNKEIQTAGYGYIGINAGKVPSIKVRQAIMHSINTQECVDYYKTTAKAIYRSMSMSSWAYPKGCTPYYPYIGGEVPDDLSIVNPDYRTYVTKLGKKAGDKLTTEEQDKFIQWLVGDLAGYTVGGDGIYRNGSDKLDYEFAIAGQETDHPAYNAMLHAKELLERNNFKVTVKPRQDALKQLSTGGLTVWAAAWGSTIDPDMYQVYHKDSTATSVLNWGYKQILLNAGNKYSVEYKLVTDLSKLIDQGRKKNDEKDRAPIYKACLDMVMQLAVELPTYQRNDLFAYNANVIDVSTFTPDGETSSFKGLTSDLHKLSLVVKER